jgi:tetratricopeptide (TPR) repeat protein
MRRLALILCIALPLAAQEARLASDYEIAQMEQQLARSHDFASQLSGRLNLGDARFARNERSLARAEYAKALDLSERERIASRRNANLTRYADATAYAALAEAKLGRDAHAFELLEEATRYASDDAETWNLYASAMRILGHPRKAISAARNAVAAAKKPLDVAIYQYALATALLDAGDASEAQRLLADVTSSLRSNEFALLRAQAAKQEAFEVYSSARGDVDAYVSLLNRSQLRLGALYEERGDVDAARTQYERVLEGRTDDVTALAALARLANDPAEGERLYGDAFLANPFSMPLVREYRKWLRAHRDTKPSTETQRALVQLERGNTRAARVTLDALLEKFPENETLRALRREADAARTITLPSATPTATELRALLDGFEQLTPEQRAALDATTFTSSVIFDGEPGTTFASGTIDGVPFRFSEPTIFNGTFATHARLTYRILGVGEGAALLLEPVGVQ